MMKSLFAEIRALGGLIIAALAHTAPINVVSPSGDSSTELACSPKEPGAVRVGIVLPKIDMGSGADNGSEALCVVEARYSWQNLEPLLHSFPRV